MKAPGASPRAPGDTRPHSGPAAGGSGRCAARAARLFCGSTGRAPVPEPDDDVDAGVAEVQRMCVTLAPEADHGDLAVEKTEISIAMNRCHVVGLLLRIRPLPAVASATAAAVS